MNTIFHSYHYRLSNVAERKAYHELSERLQTAGYKRFHAFGSYYYPDLDGLTITLETKHIFDNQWNTAPIGKYMTGLRIFDWGEEYNPSNPDMKRGHYIDLTPEMIAVRQNTLQCGYCGAYYKIESAPVFCTKCLDSPYLKEKDFPLLRLQTVENKWKHKFTALTDTEVQWLKPQYLEAQVHGQTGRNLAKLYETRANVEKEYQNAIDKKIPMLIAEAEVTRTGFTWLLDHGIDIENCIYYGHRHIFNFGWRSPLSDEVRVILREKLKNFPYPYQFDDRKR